MSAAPTSAPSAQGASAASATRAQVAVGAGVLLTAAALAVGAIDIPSNAGYGAGKRPRSATIVITKTDGGVIGS